MTDRRQVSDKAWDSACAHAPGSAVWLAASGPAAPPPPPCLLERARPRSAQRAPGSRARKGPAGACVAPSFMPFSRPGRAPEARPSAPGAALRRARDSAGRPRGSVGSGPIPNPTRARQARVCGRGDDRLLRGRGCGAAAADEPARRGCAEQRGRAGRRAARRGRRRRGRRRPGAGALATHRPPARWIPKKSF